MYIPACYPETFVCTDAGACLKGPVRCDGVDNCADGLDEANCSKLSK